MAGASSSRNDAKLAQFAYSGTGKVHVSKDAMEMELKNMKSFNRDVYEARVRRNYLEERVCRALYTQKLAIRRNEKLAVQRERTAERIAREIALNTPYLRDKGIRERHVHMHAQERANQAPRFSDLAQIDARLASANLAARGVAPSDAIAHPATTYELTLRETTKLPPNGSLMNPRNQCTSPLPDKSLLLPYLPTDDEGDATRLNLRGLVTQLTALFELKRRADLEAETRKKARPRLLDVFRQQLYARGESEEAVRESLAELRHACGLHSSHPKVALFQSMAGWGEDGMPWEATRSSACLLLMLMLKPKPDEATKVSQRFSPSKLAAKPIDLAAEVPLEDVVVLLQYLMRKGLLTKQAVTFLRDAAHKHILPPKLRGAFGGPRALVDKVLWTWMSSWGSWQYQEDPELLFGLISKFQALSPSRSPTFRGVNRRPTHESDGGDS